MAVETETLPFQNFDATKVNILDKESGEQSNQNPDPDKEEGGEGTTTETTTETTNEAQTEGTTTEDAPGGGQAEGGQEEPGEYTEEQFNQDVNTLIANTTGGKIKTLDQIGQILNDYTKLKADFDKKEPTFPSPEAKAVYDLATKAVGLEVKTAKQLFHVMSLDLASMTPKEKQFEAFHLKRANLSREEAMKRFEASYEKNYSDMENDLLQQDAHELATEQAEADIKAKLTELESVKQSSSTQTPQPSEADIAAMNADLDAALGSFGGVSLKFDDAQYGKLDIPVDQGKAQQFREILQNPYAIIDQIADNHRDASGKLNVSDFVREMYLLFDRDRIQQMERDHLMKLGKVAQIREVKNTGKTDKTEQRTAEGQKSFKDTMLAAVQGAGLAN